MRPNDGHQARITVTLPPEELSATNLRTREIVEGDARRVIQEVSKWVAAGDIIVLGKNEMETR